jgi:hypothetical protein
MTLPSDVAEAMVMRWEAAFATSRAGRLGSDDYVASITMTRGVRDKMIIDITVALNEAIRRAHG